MNTGHSWVKYGTRDHVTLDAYQLSPGNTVTVHAGWQASGIWVAIILNHIASDHMYVLDRSPVALCLHVLCVESIQLPVYTEYSD